MVVVVVERRAFVDKGTIVVGCRHQTEADIEQRWRFCRRFFRLPLYACVCCSGPHTRPGELCMACRPTIDDILNEIFETEV